MTDPNLWGIEKDMAKRQTRRSISVSRSTYERVRSYCETNGISMSQFVETRVGDFLGRSTRRLGDERLSGTVASAPLSVASTRPPPVVFSPVRVAPVAPVAASLPGPAQAPAPGEVPAPVTAAPTAVARAPVARPVVPSASVASSTAPIGTVGRPAPTPAPRPAPAPAKLTPDQIFTF